MFLIWIYKLMPAIVKYLNGFMRDPCSVMDFRLAWFNSGAGNQHDELSIHISWCVFV